MRSCQLSASKVAGASTLGTMRVKRSGSSSTTVPSLAVLVGLAGGGGSPDASAAGAPSSPPSGTSGGDGSGGGAWNAASALATRFGRSFTPPAPCSLKVWIVFWYHRSRHSSSMNVIFGSSVLAMNCMRHWMAVPGNSPPILPSKGIESGSSDSWKQWKKPDSQGGSGVTGTTMRSRPDQLATSSCSPPYATSSGLLPFTLSCRSTRPVDAAGLLDISATINVRPSST
mmetsp:Transcript_1432/g.3608  ORF Transcript_1432/g.3608 Transcript_1432/m.3608 type:complete len:228 (+) Transcript_1432:297-980(+)